MHPQSDTMEVGPVDSTERRAAVAELARAHGRRVFQVAYRVLGDGALAEDVQQTVFLGLLEKPRDNVESWPAYLSTAATRAALDELRRRSRWSRLTPTWLDRVTGDDDSPEALASKEGRAASLRRALGRIRPLEATCFSLRYFQGMALGDIARTLTITENHVSVTLHRAVKSLGSLLQPLEEIPQEEKS